MPREIPSSRARAVGLSRADLLAMPAALDLVTAGRALGLGRTKAYELVRAGEFPVRVMRLGPAYRVATADLLKLLGIELEASPAHRPATQEAAEPRGGA